MPVGSTQDSILQPLDLLTQSFQDRESVIDHQIEQCIKQGIGLARAQPTYTIA